MQLDAFRALAQSVESEVYTVRYSVWGFCTHFFLISSCNASLTQQKTTIESIYIDSSPLNHWIMDQVSQV